MKFFLHTPSRVRIINEEQEFSCPPKIFAVLEGDYPGLPEGKNYRYWTPDYSYVDGDLFVFPDLLNCLPFINKVADYNHSLPVIYAHVTISKTELCVNADPSDAIVFSAMIKPSTDPESSNLPVDGIWYIRLRHQDGFAFDSFRSEFINGDCTEMSYTYKEGLPLGIWELHEEDFAPVQAGGQWYQVKLVAPITFAVYREL
jgi:hypothetical protein